MMCTGPYRIPAVHGRHRLALTNTVPITAYRGAGRPDMAYAVERLVEEAARQLGQDRLALRRLNLLPKDAFPYTLPTGGPMAATYDSGDYPGLLDMAAEAADWAGFEARRAEAAGRGKLRGIGIGVFVEPSGGVVPRDEVAITFDAEGGVRVHNVSHSSGQGHETVFPEIVAGILGLDPAAVTLHQGDPDGMPLFGGGAFASRSMLSHGAATAVAAREVVRKGLDLAADALEAAATDIEYQAGAYRIVGTDRAVTLLELARPAEGQESGPAGHHHRPAGRPRLSVRRARRGGGGRSRDRRGVAAALCRRGRLRRGAEPHLAGRADHGRHRAGSGPGAGRAVRVRRGRAAPVRQLHGLRDAARRNAARHRPDGAPGAVAQQPLGVKGAGEAGTTGSLPAAMNAILDALRPAGVRRLDMPASAQRVWAALRAARPRDAAPPS